MVLEVRLEVEDEPGESMAGYTKWKARKWQRLAAVPTTQITSHSSLFLLQKCRGDQWPITQKESKNSKHTILCKYINSVFAVYVYLLIFNTISIGSDSYLSYYSISFEI